MFKLLYIAFLFLFQNDPVYGEYESGKANLMLKENGNCIHTVLKGNTKKTLEYTWESVASDNILVKDDKGKVKYDFVLLKEKDETYLIKRKEVEKVKNHFYILETSDSLKELLVAREALWLVLKRKSKITSQR